MINPVVSEQSTSQNTTEINTGHDGKAQLGLYDENDIYSIYIEVNIAQNKYDELRHVIKSVRDTANRIRLETACCYANIAFDQVSWKSLQPHWTPAELRPFYSLSTQSGIQMPATQTHCLFWLHGNNLSDVQELALGVSRTIGTCGEIVRQTQGCVRRDSRDLIGFVDGTGNPKDDKRRLAAELPEGHTGAGGSYVFAQRWHHQLDKFESLSISDQEQVVGRTKLDDVEFEQDVMPANAHVARNDVAIDGVPMKMYRRSAPFVEQDAHGLFFLAFACEMKRFDVTLNRMMGLEADRITDRILDYSTATTGGLWFMPSEKDLQEILG